MASFARLASQSCRLISATNKLKPIQNVLKSSSCFISTSKKHKDDAIATTQVEIYHPVKVDKSKDLENLEAKEENWISYGYSMTDREEDELFHHLIMFGTITICLVGGGFFLAYTPDYKERAWVQRQAYLELEKRERLGLPLVDRNYVDPSKIDLPSDEELGDFDVVI